MEKETEEKIYNGSAKLVIAKTPNDITNIGYFAGVECKLVLNINDKEYVIAKQVLNRDIDIDGAFLELFIYSK